jgi:hypothetical protein
MDDHPLAGGHQLQNLEYFSTGCRANLLFAQHPIDFHQESPETFQGIA